MKIFKEKLLSALRRGPKAIARGNRGFSFILACLALLTVCAIAECATTSASDTIMIREGGVDYEVHVPLTGGQLIFYNNDEDCGGGHTTQFGAHYYNHCHVNYTLPITGTAGGATKTVTATNIQAFWDHYYDGYDSSGSEDIASNCHGYAFGYGTWVQDASTYPDADDVTDTSSWSDTDVLRDGDTHSDHREQLWFSRLLLCLRLW